MATETQPAAYKESNFLDHLRALRIALAPEVPDTGFANPARRPETGDSVTPSIMVDKSLCVNYD
jgi:hypothetical protein